MKKFLRFLLILILLVAVVVVVAGLMAPKETNITSTTMIDAPKAAVWEQMVKFKNWDNWSYWHKMDTAQQVTYTGVDGEVGSSYSWVGEQTGEGSMANKGIENSKMLYELKIVKPFAGLADGYIMAEDAGNGTTRATWTYHTVNDNFLMKAMGYLFMNKMLQGQFDEGLANLKKYAEEHKGEMAAAAPAITVQETQYGGNTYAGYRAKVAWQDFDKAFGEAMGKLGARVTGAPVSIIYNWDTVKMVGDVFMGAPISAGDAIKGASVVNLPASRAYLVVYTGDPSGTKTAHDAIGAHMAAKKEKETLIIEEFVKTEPEEKDINKFVTNVYYLVK